MKRLHRITHYVKVHRANWSALRNLDRAREEIRAWMQRRPIRGDK